MEYEDFTTFENAMAVLRHFKYTVDDQEYRAGQTTFMARVIKHGAETYLHCVDNKVLITDVATYVSRYQLEQQVGAYSVTPAERGKVSRPGRRTPLSFKARERMLIAQGYHSAGKERYVEPWFRIYWFPVYTRKGVDNSFAIARNWDRETQTFTGDPCPFQNLAAQLGIRVDYPTCKQESNIVNKYLYESYHDAVKHAIWISKNIDHTQLR